MNLDSTTILSIPRVFGSPGATFSNGIVTVPILINDATDLVSLNLRLTYDNDLLSIVDPNSATTENEGVRRAGISQDWVLLGQEQELANPVANVDEDAGEILISLVKTDQETNQTSGKILEIDFAVADDAAIGALASIDLEVDEEKSRIGIGNEDLIIGDASLDDGDVRISDPALLVREEDFLADPSQYMNLIRDFDGNDLGSADSWKSIGSVDVQGDGDIEHVFSNPVNGRWASVGADINGVIDFSNYGQGGDTRVVGIYIDPLVEAGIVERNGDFDSQRRFQNDLLIDNLTVIEGSGFSYDRDEGNFTGLQEIYFRVNDGTAVLHAYMHADGNIRYANYQSASDLETFMTESGIDRSVWGNFFAG